MLQRMYQVRDELAMFVREKVIVVPELSDFAFLVEITNKKYS